MHKWYMKSFQIVITIKCPVRVDNINIAKLIVGLNFLLCPLGTVVATFKDQRGVNVMLGIMAVLSILIPALMAAVSSLAFPELTTTD